MVTPPVPFGFAIGFCVIKPNRRYRPIVAAVLGRLHGPLAAPLQPDLFTNERFHVRLIAQSGTLASVLAAETLLVHATVSPSSSWRRANSSKRSTRRSKL